MGLILPMPTNLLRWLCVCRVQLFCIFALLFFLPVPLCLKGKEFLCLYIVLIMCFLWATEAMPLQITALTPVFAYPLLQLLPASVVSLEYFNKVNMIFFGVLLMALAVQASGLHERIALRIMLFTGTSPLLLMLGVQLSSAFLSMWITNAAVAAMMLPIVLSIISLLEKCRLNGDGQPQNVDMKQNEANGKIADIDLNFIDDPARAKFYKGLLLSLCYSSSIGGIGTLIGTAPNLVFARTIKMASQQQQVDPINFLNWAMFAMPAMALMLLLCWLWLGWMFVGLRNCQREDESMKKYIYKMLRQYYDSLGPLKYSEATVLCCFLLQLFLWTSRPILWGRWFGMKYPAAGVNNWNEENVLLEECTRPKAEEFVHDSTVAVFVSFLLFILPAENPFSKTEPASKYQYKPILRWDDMERNFEWTTLLLMGGSFAMAKGVECTGLSSLIGRVLDFPLLRSNALLFTGFACALATLLTEFSSNTATATILLTTLRGMTENGQHQRENGGTLERLILYGIPVTISCSFSFMLPAGTPPNAIVFGSGLIRVVDMVKAGFVLNILGLLVVVFLSHYYAPLVFGSIISTGQSQLSANNSSFT